MSHNVSPSPDSDSGTSSYLDWLLEHTKKTVLEIQMLKNINLFII